MRHHALPAPTSLLCVMHARSHCADPQKACKPHGAQAILLGVLHHVTRLLKPVS